MQGYVTTLSFEERPRSKNTVGQGKNSAEIFLLCSVSTLSIESFVIKDSDPTVVLRKNCFKDVAIRRSLSRSITNLWPAQSLNALNAYIGAPSTGY